MLKTQIGTPIYFSPEEIDCGNYNQMADVWSLGVTIYEVIANIYPFGDPHMLENKFAEITANERMKAIKDGDFLEIEGCPAKIMEIIKGMLQV